MTKKLTEAEWDTAFANLEASPVSEATKEYYRRTWMFLREEKSYSRDDFRIVARGTVGPIQETRA